VSPGLEVRYSVLEQTARALEHMAAQLALAVPRITAVSVRACLHELVPFGILSALPVAADLLRLCLPGVPGSLPDEAAELLALAAAVRAAELGYRAVDAAGWARAELPTAEALLMLAAWNRIHAAVGLSKATGVPFVPQILDRAGEAALEQADRWIEGSTRLRDVDPTAMPAVGPAPASGLDTLLGVVDTISDADHPSTVALLRVGDDPPRYVLCLPGLQDATRADASAADLPGALATLAGHSAYIRGMRTLLAGLPAGSRVLLVGHSQGGMVAEALAGRPHVGRATIAGVLTAGAPQLAEPVARKVPVLALVNSGDPVPRMGRLAGGSMLPGLPALPALPALPQLPELRALPLPRAPGEVVFSTRGEWVGPSKHGLGGGGYLAKAGSSDPRLASFREQVSEFLTPGPVSVRFVQVTDSDGGLPR
jgi:hypothetical protein